MYSTNEYTGESSLLIHSENVSSEVDETLVAHKEHEPASSVALTVTIAIFGSSMDQWTFGNANDSCVQASSLPVRTMLS